MDTTPICFTITWVEYPNAKGEWVAKVVSGLNPSICTKSNKSRVSAMVELITRIRDAGHSAELKEILIK